MSLLDIAERSQKGPKMEIKDWDLSLFRKMAELAGKYEIRHPEGRVWFNEDDALVERAFEAAVEFLAEAGVYCLTTGRVVQFTRDEVRDAIAAGRPEVTVGAGRDQRMLRQKRIEGVEPLNQTPGHHAPFSEDLASLVVKNFAQIPSADYLEGFNFTNVDGREVYGMPIEAYAARREAAWLREGIRKAGRPGMAIAYYPISTRSSVLIAPMDPDYGLRRTDGILLSVLPDIKMEQDLLTAAIVYEDYGCFRVNGGGAGSIGGFCGGVEGAIIEGIVKPIAGWMCYRDHTSYAGVGHVSHTLRTTFGVDPAQFWATSVVCQALNRYTNTICFGGNAAGGDSGPGTETRLLALAIGCLPTPINGMNLLTSRHQRAKMNTGLTPLEPEWRFEVAQASIRSGLTRKTAPRVLDALAAQLDGRPVEPAQSITECYDLVHHRPESAYEEIYLRVKDAMARLGIDFG
ncbi:MAG: monomethylamine:corrinoid methyltransferase [Chloroflexi bacterium]|nr:monomethylamine:corrinoid methyltransferase [Chloroflexota bacterium]